MYHGQKFSGVVKVSRPDTCRHWKQFFHIGLDFPISIDGEIRNGVAVSVDSTGRDSDCWAGDTWLDI